jgi:hypothetical protein
MTIPGFASARALAPLAGLALVAGASALGASTLSAQGAERFGEWLLASDAPPPSRNVMTYEPWGEGGMKITVASTNARGDSSEWGYVTLFDGVFRPVEGQEGSETAVEVIDDRSTRITNRRNGRLTQIIINTLSDDGNTIENDYVRLDADGRITRVTRAIYERIR